MKNKIIEKLFNDESLSQEEILFVSQNLTDNATVPFDHLNNDIFKSCGVKIENCNLAFNGLQETSFNSISKFTEALEIQVNQKPELKRIICLKIATGFADEQRRSERSGDSNSSSKSEAISEIKRLIELLKKSREL